jgi:hypothetical protein
MSNAPQRPAGDVADEGVAVARREKLEPVVEQRRAQLSLARATILE